MTTSLATLARLAATASLHHQAGNARDCAETLDQLYASIAQVKDAHRAVALAGVGDEGDAFDPQWSDDYIAPTLAEMLDASMLVEPEAVIGLAPVGALLEEGAIPLTGEVALASAGSQAEAACKHRRQVAANKRAALFAGLDRLVG